MNQQLVLWDEFYTSTLPYTLSCTSLTQTSAKNLTNKRTISSVLLQCLNNQSLYNIIILYFMFSLNIPRIIDYNVHSYCVVDLSSE